MSTYPEHIGKISTYRVSLFISTRHTNEERVTVRARAIMDLASVFLTLLINIFFRKSFAFRFDILQLLLLAGLSFSCADSVTFALSATGFGALALGKVAFPNRFSRLSLLLPNWDKQVSGQSGELLSTKAYENCVSFVTALRTYSTSCARCPSSIQ